MDPQAPLSLSALAARLLRRPPSLRELVTLVGYADDYAWFAGLVHRLFPLEAEAVLAAPDARERVGRFAHLFSARHYPLYLPHIEFLLEDGDEPPWCWLRRGIPYDLMGIGYDGLHELWEAYRPGIAALGLLAEPPDALYVGPDGLRVAWLEAAAEHIPRETLERIPPGGVPLDVLAGAAAGTGFEACAQGAQWVWAETGIFFLDACYDDGMYDGFADPWDDDVIAEGTAEWGKAVALMDAVGELADWLEEDLPARFARMLDAVLAGLPRNKKEARDHDHGSGKRPVVPAGKR